MTVWRAVWKMTSFGWRQDWRGALLTFLFAMYIGWMLGFTTNSWLREKDAPLSWLVDWMYLMVVPCFGTLMNRTSWGISRDDSHTKKIAFFRTMPIPLPAILIARMMTAWVLIPLIGTSFMLLQYGVSPAIRERMTLVQWLAVGVIWLCYGLAVNAVLIGWEMSCSGKRFVRYYFVFIFAAMAAAVILNFGGMSAFEESVRQIQADRYEWLAIAPAAAAVSMYAGYKTTLKRMRRRSYRF